MMFRNFGIGFYTLAALVCLVAGDFWCTAICAFNAYMIAAD